MSNKPAPRVVVSPHPIRTRVLIDRNGNEIDNLRNKRIIKPKDQDDPVVEQSKEKE